MNKTAQLYEADKTTVNALAAAMGALAMSVAHTMTAEQRLAMADALDKAALLAEAQGDRVQQSLIARMHMVIHRPPTQG